MSPKELIVGNPPNASAVDFSLLMTEIRRYMPDADENRLKQTVDYAADAHAGQFRKDNKPYITHPFETARILASMHVDVDTIIAALLHDVPEDTSHSISEIESVFGKEIAFLVDGVTKLSKVYYHNDMARRQIASLKKLFLHTARDPRIILIKLADRLHNMRTLKYIDNEQKRLRIARETLEIFVPIANLLSIEEMKSELEDLCFRYLLPDEYMNLAERMKRNGESNRKTMDETVDILEKELKKNNVSASVGGRQLHLYGIYKKVMNRARLIAEYDNLISIRILVSDNDDCYKALGIVHSLFKPKPGKFNDYIAVPKVNGYQSLHTSVFGINGVTTQFQIRTHKMHLEAGYGMASRYFKIVKTDKQNNADEDKHSLWVKKIEQLDKLQERDEEFIEDLKRDVLRDRIFVFTPTGESIDLPQDATCIDFAYQIHTEVGHRALKADLNGEMVPMATTLKSGDTVRIITSDLPKGPDRSWLPFAKTNTAKSRIRDYFKKTSRENKIFLGKSLLQKELDRAGLGLVKNVPNRKIKNFICKNKQCQNMDDVLTAIGEGTLRAFDFVSDLYPQKSATLGKIKWFEIQVTNKHEQVYTPVAIRVISRDIVGQMSRILSVVSSLNISVLKTKSYNSFWSGDFILKQTLAIKSFSVVSRLFENLEQIDGVKKVERLFWQRKVFFFASLTAAFLIWTIHPYVLHYLAINVPKNGNEIFSVPLLYLGLFMLFLMVFSLKNLTQRSFPELRETNAFWLATYMLTGFAAVTVLAEIYFFKLDFDVLIVAALILLIFTYLTAGYLRFKRRMRG
jgi:GTP diphosphokinase / guanosine-3',5'-bis(diphosphate) 3'-diphosphatase